MQGSVVVLLHSVAISPIRNKLSQGACLRFLQEETMKSTHPDADRRTSPRFACALETSCRLLGPRPEQVKARVLDVSSGGVALWLNRWYDAGTSLAIDLPTEKGNPDRRPAVVKIQ